jgi:uncharacterized protein (AIM24 family)
MFPRRGRDTFRPVTIETKLVGDAMRVVVCQLGPEECVYSEAGRFLWKTVNVAVEIAAVRPPAGLQPTVDGTGAGPGTRFLQRALATASEVSKRVMPAESVTLQRYTANGEGLVAFAGLVPGEVRVLDVAPTRGWYVERDAFLAAEATVDFELSYTGTRAGRKVADGLVLHRYHGDGTLMVAAAGELIELNPAKYDGALQVDTGCLVAFEDNLRYSVDHTGDGTGDGLGLATLRGDGVVLLQSVSVEGMAAAIARRATRDERQAASLFAGNTD